MQAPDFGFPSDEIAFWVGSLALIVVGSGPTAPPIGLDALVTRAIARQVPISEPYSHVRPDVAEQFIRLLLMFFFPVIAAGLVRWLS